MRAQAAAWSGIINPPARRTGRAPASRGEFRPVHGRRAERRSRLTDLPGRMRPRRSFQNAINACGANHFVLLGPGDFYLSGEINLKSNVVLRGSGANQTRLHFNGASGCIGNGGVICMDGGLPYSGNCIVNGTTTGGLAPQENSVPATPFKRTGRRDMRKGPIPLRWTMSLELFQNVTPIVLDQCDTGLKGSPGVENCAGGTGGIITAAAVYSGGGGSGYNVGDYRSHWMRQRVWTIFAMALERPRIR